MNTKIFDFVPIIGFSFVLFAWIIIHQYVYNNIKRKKLFFAMLIVFSGLCLAVLLPSNTYIFLLFAVIVSLALLSLTGGVIILNSRIKWLKKLLEKKGGN